MAVRSLGSRAPSHRLLVSRELRQPLGHALSAAHLAVAVVLQVLWGLLHPVEVLVVVVGVVAVVEVEGVGVVAVVEVEGVGVVRVPPPPVPLHRHLPVV